MDKKSKKQNSRDWAELVRECNESGMPKSEWCRQHGITPKSFFYHQRQIRRDTVGGQAEDTGTVEPMALAELPLSAYRPGALSGFVPAAVIRIGSIGIEVSGSIPAELLSVILKEVRHAQ